MRKHDGRVVQNAHRPNSAALANASPVQGEGACESMTERLLKIHTNLIQRHSPMPPLCKGRGTARGGGGVVQISHKFIRRKYRWIENITKICFRLQMS